MYIRRISRWYGDIQRPKGSVKLLILVFHDRQLTKDASISQSSKAMRCIRVNLTQNRSPTISVEAARKHHAKLTRNVP